MRDEAHYLFTLTVINGISCHSISMLSLWFSPCLKSFQTQREHENSTQKAVRRVLSITPPCCPLLLTKLLEFSHLNGVYHFSAGIEHPLPNPRQIPQVENVVKLGRGWKHLDLGQLPQAAGQRHQAGHYTPNLLSETTVCTEVALTNYTYTTGLMVGGCLIEGDK